MNIVPEGDSLHERRRHSVPTIVVFHPDGSDMPSLATEQKGSPRERAVETGTRVDLNSERC